MVFPVSDPWNLLDLRGATFAAFAGLSTSEAVVTPTGSGVARLNGQNDGLEITESEGTSSALEFVIGIPARFTLQLVLRCPRLPHNLGDLEARRFGLTLADDAGRGLSLYFAKTGVAIGRVDHLGAVTALPDTSEVTAAVAQSFWTLRIAVDGPQGRAYVFLAEGVTDAPPLRWIVPIEQTPKGMGDAFRIFAKGQPREPVFVELAEVRLGADLVLANYPPLADAGVDRVAPVGQAVRLDGRASYDIEGAPLTYRWQCVDAPYGSTYAAEFTRARAVDDGDGDETTTFIEVAASAMPVWAAPGDVLRLAGGVYEVAAVDAAGGFLELVSDSLPLTADEPARLIGQSVLLDTTSPTPTAVPDVAGIYRFWLTVHDGDSASEPSEVLARITALQTPAGIEPDCSVIWDAIGDEWRQIGGHDVFEEAWVGVSQILAGKLLEAWQCHYNSSIRDVQRVYQRKWIAYRTFLAETAPEDATVTARYGGFLARYAFEQGIVPLAGEVLELRYLAPSGAREVVRVYFVAAAYDAETTAQAINGVLQQAGLTRVWAEARTLRRGGARLLVQGTLPFQLAGSACAVLGLPVEAWNRLEGQDGARVTDRSYFVEGIDLARAGVQRGDLLVINRGECLRIDRVFSDPGDAHPSSRLLLQDILPLDASPAWSIPSLCQSSELDYERAGAYPGDLAKTETVSPRIGQVTEQGNVVVGQRGTQLAVVLDEAVMAALEAGTEVRLLGLKRRKAIPLPVDVVSVPTLQELVVARLNPDRYHEHVDYVLEPFYRDDGRPTPMLQFHDRVFIDLGLEPPDVLWAEVTLFDNAPNVEDLFGRLVGFLRDDAAGFPEGFDYVAGVAGLLYAQQRGPTLFGMSVGAQILLGQPFAEVAGYIEEVRPDFSARQGRLLVRDDDGNTPTESDTVRTYFWTKDPADASSFSGLALHPTYGRPWAVGDQVPQFSPLGAGVALDDIYTRPEWWRTYAGGGAMYEIEKYHRFVCTFDLRVVDLANISLLAALLTRAKPTYARLMLVGDAKAQDDLDVTDTRAVTVRLQPYETLLGWRGYRFDDYRGDGSLSCAFDDGVTRFDALVDSIVDTLRFDLTIQWPGGALTFPTQWPFDLARPVIDVGGSQTGVAGRSFTLASGMTLAAGTYQTSVITKSGPVLSPL